VRAGETMANDPNKQDEALIRVAYDNENVDDTTTPPELAAQQRAHDPEIQARIDEAITLVCGADVTSRDAAYVRDLITAALKLIPDGRHTGELKLMSSAMKELRYAMRVFGEYPEELKVTIFGSARTPEGHPDYQSAVDFSRIMADRGWMSITGAGDGIMKAGHEGPGRQSSFGVAIYLPFEQSTNTVIAGDSKLINFRYFFTRKLTFLSQADAVVCFPGGFGTFDEVFETLTLIQTGKAALLPLVLLEGEHPEGGWEGTPPPSEPYWTAFDRLLREQLMARGWISPEDTDLYYIAKDAEDAADHVCKFYRNYHSSRYVGDNLVIRLRHRLDDAQVEALGEEFAGLIASGGVTQRGPFEVETDHLDLPRVVFHHTRHQYAIVKQFIERLNELDPVESPAS
jgi:uncharacterized protein (TIGR00730 family)